MLSFRKGYLGLSENTVLYDKELLSVYSAIAHFRYLIEGRNVIVYTDHKPLTFAFSKIGCDKELPRRARQIMFISEFTTDIRHISGSDNVVADTLSRIPYNVSHGY